MSRLSESTRQQLSQAGPDESEKMVASEGLCPFREPCEGYTRGHIKAKLVLQWGTLRHPYNLPNKHVELERGLLKTVFLKGLLLRFHASLGECKGGGSMLFLKARLGSPKLPSVPLALGPPPLKDPIRKKAHRMNSCHGPFSIRPFWAASLYAVPYS